MLNATMDSAMTQASTPAAWPISRRLQRRAGPWRQALPPDKQQGATSSPPDMSPSHQVCQIVHMPDAVTW